LGNIAFFQCHTLAEINIGNSIRFFGYMCFAYCYGLKSIHVNTDVPLNLEGSPSAFLSVDPTKCVLHVPMGAKSVYAVSNQWNYFTNIVEDSLGYYPLQKTVRLADMEGSSGRVVVVSTVDWGYHCDQPWMKIVRMPGSGKDTLLLSAEANTSSLPRSAILLLTSIGFESKRIVVKQAASPKILTVIAGGLLASLLPEERRRVSNLVLSGTLDSRDFRILRDSLPMLSRLDLSATDILAHTGNDGTSTVNEANSIPENAFYDSYTNSADTMLETVLLPLSATAIGKYAFQFCSALNEVFVQKNVRVVDDYAFNYCTSLTQIDLSKSVASIGYSAFSNCTKLQRVVMGDSLKTVGSYAFTYCSCLDSIGLGNNLISIGNTCFGNCNQLTSILLPESVTSIGNDAFRYCSQLKDIYLNWEVPLAVPNNFMTIYLVDTMNCVLHIPYATKAQYQATIPWRSFQKMQEYPTGFYLDTKALTLSNAEGSKATFGVWSNTNWTVHSDMDWLQVVQTSGFGNDTIELVAKFNALSETRFATITVQSRGLKTRYIDVVQESSVKYVTIAAGGLYSALNARERKMMDKLVIQGTVDARDFRVIRDSLPKLRMLDMDQTVVAAYTGKDGTSTYQSYESYEANSIPHHAFINPNSYRTSLLKNIRLPHSITTIEFCALQGCSFLDSLYIPQTVTTLGSDVFRGCSALKKLTFSNSIKSLPYHVCHSCISLTDIVLPDSVTTINDYAFAECQSLVNLTFGKKLMSIGEEAFASCFRLKRIVLPGSLKTIARYAFGNDQFESISIPQSVTSIASYALYSNQLKAVHVYTKIPLKLESSYVFGGFVFSKCVLYVPKGAKAAYQSDPNWAQFVNMEEGQGLSVSERNVILHSGGQKTVDLYSSQSWSISSNKPWLTFSQTSGSGDVQLTITAQQNPSYTAQTAVVTIVSADSTIPDMVMTVVEYGKEKTVTITPNGLYVGLTKTEVCTVSNLVIKGEMDARDFRILRDSMPQLAMIDLSAVTIKSYYGDFGTIGLTYYLPNALPPESFHNLFTMEPNVTLTQIRLPENLVSIGSNAFMSAVGLTNIVLPNKVTSIAAKAFYGCTALDSMDFGTSLLSIGESAFYNCGFKSLVLPSSLQTIEGSVFSESPLLTSVVIPNSVTYIGYEAFFYCPRLMKVVLPNALKTLERCLFLMCSKLTDVVIPESVTTIRAEAFSECTSLYSINIPSNVTKIENGAFEFCTNLTSIVAMPIKPVDLSTGNSYPVFPGVDKTTCTLFVPAGTKAQYASSVEWMDFINLVEQAVPVAAEQVDRLAVSPNPVRHDFSIHGLMGAGEYTLTDLNGKVMLHGLVQGNNSVSSEGLQDGMYVLRIKTSEGYQVCKFVKEN
jgi:hypothetical protein